MATLEESHLVRGLVTLPRSPRNAPKEAAAEASSAEPLDGEGGVVENLRHLLPLLSVHDNEKYSTTRRVRYLNDLAKVIKHVGHVIDPYYPVEKVIEVVRLSLVSLVKEVRAGALRVLRYLLASKDVFSLMLKLRIDLLVARSLDVPATREIERLQAMRFARQALTLSPQTFPATMVAPMVSILLQDSEPIDNLTWSCMATLSELALLNTELAAKTGAIKALLRGLLKCQTPRISESVTLTLSFLLNSPTSRKYIRSQLDMESLLAPITDLHYRYMAEDMERHHLLRSLSDHELKVEASKMVVISMLKSWAGMFCLCNPVNSGISSLLSMLPLAKPYVQRDILSILYSVFQLKEPEWTDDYHAAVSSIDPAQPRSEWSLAEGWVAEEGKVLLPPKTVGKTNLINCYQALLLAAVMEVGLFEHLVKVVHTADGHITVMATILMGQLLHLANTILPQEFSADSQGLHDLIVSAMAFDTQVERNRASEVISCLDRVHQLKKQEIKPSSLYLKLILEQSGYFTGHRPSMDQDSSQHIPADIDETTLGGLVKDTNVLSTKEYQKWKWDLIFSLLQHPSLRSYQLMEDAIFTRFIKRLCNFYKPSNHLYSIISYSESNSRRYTSVAQQLVRLLCRTEESSTGFLTGLVSDIVSELMQVTASKLTADAFSSTSVAHKMSRDYFLLLGTVSFHKVALLSQCKVYGPLLDICNYQNRSDLMKLIIATMDFSRDAYSRVILSKILTASDKDMRLYATRHMRVLLRAKVPFFNSWGLELLIPQLYDLDNQVAVEAVDILDEACEEETFLEALVLQQPALIHVGEKKGASLLTRFFSVKRGFSMFSRLGYVDKGLDLWYKDINTRYVYFVEERLAESLTSYQQTGEGEFVRRTSTSLIHPLPCFVPVHFYGQLVQHEEGCAVLEKEGHVAKFAEAIRMEPDTKDKIVAVKAAVWALGHIGSYLGGLDLLLKEEVLGDLMDMAEECPVLSIRGTCFYALCLISRTPHGAEILLDEGWTSVQHTMEVKWPLVFEHNIEPDDGTFASPVTSPVKPFPPLFGSFDLSTLPSMNKSSSIPRIQSESFHLNTVHHTASSQQPDSNSVKEKTPGKLITRKSSKKFFVSVKESGRSPSLVRFRGERIGTSFLRKQAAKESRLPRPMSMGNPLSPTFSHSSSTGQLTPSATRKRSLGGGIAPFIGVCLPLNIMAMFEYEEMEFEGLKSRTAAAPEFDLDALSHEPSQCLECMLTRRRQTSSSSTESFRPVAPTSNSTHSPELRSPSRTDDGAIGPHTTVRITGTAEEDEEETEVEGEGEEGPKRDKSHQGIPDPKQSNRDLIQREARERTPTCLGKETQKDKRNRSPSPLLRMKRVESDGDLEMREGGKEDDKESPENKTDFELGEGEKEAEGEKGSSAENSSQETSGKEGSSSQSSGAKEILVNVPGSSTSEGAAKSSQSQGDTGDDSTSISSTTTTQSTIEEESQEGRRRLHKAILELVYSLSSDISMKKNTMGLNFLCQQFPSLGQDLCLYSKVMELLSTYQYHLNTRRFIQSKFSGMTFAQLFVAKPSLEEEVYEEDLVSSTTSSRRESVSSADVTSESDILQRRRSSTSDVLRFRQMLQPRSAPHSHEVVTEILTNTDNKNANNSVELEVNIDEASPPSSTGTTSRRGLMRDKGSRQPHPDSSNKSDVGRSPQSQGPSGDSGDASQAVVVQAPHLQTARSNDSGVLSVVNVTFDL